MGPSVILSLLLFIEISARASSGRYSDVEAKYRPVLNFTEAAARDGYFTEEHRVVTEDGYVLTVFRLTKGKYCSKIRQPPVLLMHGLLQSADAWIDAGPEAALGYLIAEECYDLWLGNVRGNYYSRRHVTLDPGENSAFWEFSLNEVGVYDLPAIIDYVINNTKADKINYIGYSQSGGAIVIMCSERPGYCSKVQLAVLLNPASRLKHTISGPFRLLNKFYGAVAPYLVDPSDLEALPRGSALQEILERVCDSAQVSNATCSVALEAFDSAHPGSITASVAHTALAHFPAGTSAKSLTWFSQTLDAIEFRKFDYGSSTNLLMYGTREPPPYNISAADVPVVIVYGESDYIVTPKDVVWLRYQLPNVLELYPVADARWNHLDTAYSRHNKRMTFPKINEYLFKNSH